eukprot:Seg237.6 transcript_id=Seg237.6/GoldUCD/mRNA.D3Y31 product="Protein transport protein Sec31A" protein_id=Seg237.6/GoldUCD/D3Y31
MAKVKEVQRTANIAWSPAEQHPIYLAAGTAAQQLDATFSTTAALEIFHVDFGNSAIEMPVAGSIECSQRLHKVIWGSCGIKSEEHPSGIIIGGTDNGHIFVYDAAKIINDDSEDRIAMRLDRHSGPVQALDINPYQENLLASGANDSEIFIWDLNKPDTPLTPGAKSTPLDNISCVHWNKQVQHIMASSSPSGRVVVWDLRKSEPIIKVGDTSAMLHCKSMAWHPEVATQMVIGNEDDRYPVIQLWDLRFATSPVKVMEGHSRGILSLDWCPQDPDLLMSCAKDNRILCWNPNTSSQNGEIIYELPTTSQWCFDVLWCPRNPGVLSTASFDGHVTVSSVMGSGAVPSNASADKVASSFGGDAFAGQPHEAKPLPVPEPLKKPPRWMRRPCGASFAFGGKLLTFGNFPDQPAKQVSVSQVVTEGEFLQRSGELENALLSGQLVEFCDQKIGQSASDTERTLWSFLKVNFDKEPRLQFLDLLGYHPQELAKKISSMSSIPKSLASSSSQMVGVDADELASKMQLLDTEEPGKVKSEGGLYYSGSASPAQGTKTPASDTDASSAFDRIGALSIDTSLNASTSIIDDPGRPVSPLMISVDEDTDGLVSQSLLTGNFEGAVDICFKADRMAEALILAVAGGPELFARTQKRYLDQARSSISKLISCVVGRDWRSIVETCAIDNWKEALATLVTYGRAEEFFELCDLLGQRLENEAQNYTSAIICYICSGNVERLVSCWSKTVPRDASPLLLQDLIEKVMVLKKAVEREKKQTAATSNSFLAGQLSKYGNILASQGSYETAMVYLSTINDPTVALLKDRLMQAQGQQVSDTQLPFQKVSVRATPAPKAPQAKTPTQPQPGYGFQPSPVQPTQPSQPSQYYNPASVAPSTYQGMYQPSQPTVGMPSATSQPSYGQPHAQIPGQYQPGQVPPGSQYNAPQPSVSQYSDFQPTPGVPSSQFSSNQGYGGYGMPPQGNAGPPPDSTGSQPPMSLKASKQEANQAPTQPPGMSIFNPTALEPEKPKVAQTPPGTFVPGSTVISNQAPQQPAEPEPKPKQIDRPPIPAEHMELQQTFNAVIDRCRSAANNPQTKRKLEDVTRRVESLYDMLRHSKLSPNVLAGLHQISQACQQVNYPGGLQVHTEMVIRGNFSEIGSFMPGLKTLMQIAGQLGV